MILNLMLTLTDGDKFIAEKSVIIVPVQTSEGRYKVELNDNVKPDMEEWLTKSVNEADLTIRQDL